MSRILVVDNYDSFTYNLVQLIETLGADVEVVRNDAESAGALAARSPNGVVLSPGPGAQLDSSVLRSREVTVPVESEAEIWR